MINKKRMKSTNIIIIVIAAVLVLSIILFSSNLFLSPIKAEEPKGVFGKLFGRVERQVEEPVLDNLKEYLYHRGVLHKTLIYISS